MKTSFLSKLSSEQAESNEDSSLPGPLIINRAFEFWPGAHRFFLKGKLITGPVADMYVYLLFALFMCLHFALFAFVMVPEVGEEMRIYLLSLYGVFFFCSIVFYCLTALSDPGILPPKQYLDVPRTYNKNDPVIEHSSLLRKYLGGRYGATFALHWKQQWNSSDDRFEDLIQGPLASELRSDIGDELEVVVEEPQVASYRGFGDDPDFHDEIFTYRSESKQNVGEMDVETGRKASENVEHSVGLGIEALNTSAVGEEGFKGKLGDIVKLTRQGDKNSQGLGQLLSKIDRSDSENEQQEIEMALNKPALSLQPDLPSIKSESSKKIFGPEDSISANNHTNLKDAYSYDNQSPNANGRPKYPEIESQKSASREGEWGHEANSCFESGNEFEGQHEFDTKGRNWLLEEYRSRFCPICKIHRPKFARHCPDCNCCVRMHNHHCAFVNNCLGKRNYRWFLSLMASLFLLNMYFILALFLAFPQLLQIDADVFRVVIVGCFIQSVLITGYCAYHLFTFFSYLSGDLFVVHEREQSPLRDFLSNRVRKGQFQRQYHLQSQRFESQISNLKLGQLSGSKKEMVQDRIEEMPSLEEGGEGSSESMEGPIRGNMKVMRFGKDLSLHSLTISQKSIDSNRVAQLNEFAGVEAIENAQIEDYVDRNLKESSGVLPATVKQLPVLNPQISKNGVINANKIFLSSLQEGAKADTNRNLSIGSGDNQVNGVTVPSLQAGMVKSQTNGSTDDSKRSMPLGSSLQNQGQARGVPGNHFLSQISQPQSLAASKLSNPHANLNSNPSPNSYHSDDILSSPNIVLCTEMTHAARIRRAQTSFPYQIARVFPFLFPESMRMNETLNESQIEVSKQMEDGSPQFSVNYNEARPGYLNESVLGQIERKVKPKELEILEEKEKFDFFLDSASLIDFGVELDIYESNRLSTTRKICTK